MVHSEDAAKNLDYNSVLDNLGAGLLIFDNRDKLILDNVAARRILGANLVMIRSEGWSAFAMLINANAGEQPNAQEIRSKCQREGKPTRFSMLIAGSYMPCWIAMFEDTNGKAITQIVIDNPDWTALTELMKTFRSEARAAINDTKGHSTFIRNLLLKPPAGISAADLGKRAMGMVKLISTEMHQLQLLVDMLHRLEIIRIGQLQELIEATSKKIDLEDFLEDFLEELNEDALIDPFIDAEEYRKRLIIDMEDDLYALAPKSFLRNILRDLFRNAFMYSDPPNPVKLRIYPASGGRNIQFDIIDEGCGVRAKEENRVFEPFERARQPQVMREHGYGLSLYLVKSEVEAMNGRIWIEHTEEGVGSTFSFKLPTYQKK